MHYHASTHASALSAVCDLTVVFVVLSCKIDGRICIHALVCLEGQDGNDNPKISAKKDGRERSCVVDTDYQTHWLHEVRSCKPILCANLAIFSF